MVLSTPADSRDSIDRSKPRRFDPRRWRFSLPGDRRRPTTTTDGGLYGAVFCCGRFARETTVVEAFACHRMATTARRQSLAVAQWWRRGDRKREDRPTTLFVPCARGPPAGPSAGQSPARRLAKLAWLPPGDGDHDDVDDDDDGRWWVRGGTASGRALDPLPSGRVHSHRRRPVQSHHSVSLIRSRSLVAHTRVRSLVYVRLMVGGGQGWTGSLLRPSTASS